MKDARWLWRCKNCRGVYARDDCALRYGILECPLCLPTSHMVGLLEPHETQPYCPRCECLCWERFGGCTGCGGKVQMVTRHEEAAT